MQMTWYDRAAVIPGRSMTCSKAPGRFMPIGEGPHYCTDANGARILGDDGKWYIDMLCALGAISLGYGERDSYEGNYDGVFSLPSVREVEAGEKVLQHVAPWASWVKFTKTGSEATHAAYRIAKKVTGRKHVIAGDWAYHGWHEWCQPVPVTFPHTDDSLGPMTPMGEPPAAVFIEPNRWRHTDPTWLQFIRRYCDTNGVLLVFDSMIYGGRFALGGASEYYGVVPDLECWGKAFGNGAAVAFVTGKPETLQAAEVASGTYSGDVQGMNAVCDVLNVYAKQPVIEMLWARGVQLKAGLQKIAWDSGLFACEGEPVHQRLKFINPEHKPRFSAEMAKRGVLWHQDVTNIMYAHTEAIMDEVIEAARASVAAL